MQNSQWAWPDEWRNIYPFLFLSPPPALGENRDTTQWLENGNRTMFSVKAVLGSITPNLPDVLWGDLVWFSQTIPRPSFLLWLVIKDKLKTQDKLTKWGVKTGLKCTFCNVVQDSRDHLFFQCAYPFQIWDFVKQFARMDHAPNDFTNILQFMLQRPVNKTAWSIIQRLVLGASVYYVWQERNNRIFKGLRRTPNDLINTIMQVVRLKLITLHFKNSRQVEDIATIWQFHANAGPSIVNLTRINFGQF